jgi:hypothetical protein
VGSASSAHGATGVSTRRADAPAVRARAFSLFGTVDVWRVPVDMRGDYADIFRELQGHERQLRA